MSAEHEVYYWCIRIVATYVAWLEVQHAKVVSADVSIHYRIKHTHETEI